MTTSCHRLEVLPASDLRTPMPKAPNLLHPDMHRANPTTRAALSFEDDARLKGTDKIIV